MYQKWSRMLHPDITKWPKELAKSKIMEVTEAYEILSDEERRHTYDTEGKMDIGTDANTEWKRSQLFGGTHDAYTFKSKEEMDTVIENKEKWMILFWGKNYPDCLEASEIWTKFATRMKGVVNIGTVQCDDLMQLCRSFGMRTLPTIFSLNNGNRQMYNGRIESQSLVDFAASNLLTYTDSHITHYTPGMLAVSRHAPVPSASAQHLSLPKKTIEVTETWELVTFEYTDCMDCRIELALAVETIQKYSKKDVSVIRVDCSKREHRNFCLQAPESSKAWRVAYATRSTFYAPTFPHPAFIKTTPLRLEFFPYEDRQWSTRDLTNFVFTHQKSSIVKLTSRSFYEVVLKEATAWAILFTSDDNCKSCTHYQADWEIMARITKGYVSRKNTRLRVASINCSEHEAFCSSLGLGGKLPALRMYRGGVQAKTQEPHHLNLMDPASMLQECKREMEPLELTDLNAGNFNKLVRQSSDNWFILYNAGSWCPPCNSIRQPWKDTTRILEGLPVGDKIKLGHVDCELHGQFCSTMGIGSYPTMHLHLKGARTPLNYDGDRRPDAMAAWVDELIDNHVIKATASKLKQLVKSRTTPALVAFSAGEWCPPCTMLKPIWKNLANTLHPLPVISVDCDSQKDLCQQYGIQGYPLVALYPNGPNNRKRQLVFQGNKEAAVLESWVKQILKDSFKFYPREE
eukprot:TRINITY_DN36823_c0_g1_i1.p1 TRINITY_DN36823_c0_g1~~TRINITY_DN36823_c0_g1_i1.p1  ORF type:complete len:729 (+),score=144.07 TRINITY_DN36823_c0_g1_i1:132-2189(+)